MTAALQEDYTLEILVIWAIKDVAKASPSF